MVKSKEFIKLCTSEKNYLRMHFTHFYQPWFKDQWITDEDQSKTNQESGGCGFVGYASPANNHSEFQNC